MFAFVMVLFISTMLNLVQNNIPFFIVFVFFVFGCCYSLYRVSVEEVIKQPKVTVFSKEAILLFLMVSLGSVLAYGIHIVLGCPVLGAGVGGLLGAIFIKKYQVPIYCGTFVGMSSPLLFGMWQFALATIFASIIYVLVRDLFNGYGGKLGTIALSGALISTLVARGNFAEGSEYLLMEQLIIIGFSALAALLTYILSIRFKYGPVIASAGVGVLAGLTLPFLIPDIGHTYAVVVIGASFVGMSGTNRFNDEVPIFIAGVLFGLIFVFSAPYFGGAGGKLGTIAFVSVLSVRGIMMLHERYIPKKTTC